MRRITAWIYGLLTAALLVFAIFQFLHVQRQLFSSGQVLEELQAEISRLEAENERLIRVIGEADIADDVDTFASGLEPVVRTDKVPLAENAD